MSTVKERASAQATRVGLLAIIGAVIGWGWSNTIVVSSSLQPVPFAFWRLWFGALGMSLVLAALRRRITWPMVRSSAPAGLLFCAQMLLSFLAFKHTTLANATIMTSLQPGLTLVVAGPMFGESVTRRQVVWTIVSVGAVVLAAIGSSGLPAWSAGGELAEAGSMLGWTAYWLVSKRVRSTVPTLEFVTAIMLVASVTVTPIALLSAHSLGSLHPPEIGWVLAFVLAATGGQVLVGWAHPRVDVSVSSLLILGEPIVSAAAALVVLGQAISPLEALGGLIAVGAVAVVMRDAMRRTERSSSRPSAISATTPPPTPTDQH